MQKVTQKRKEQVKQYAALGYLEWVTPVTMNPTEMQANILRVLKPSQGTARPTGHKIERQRAIHKMTGRAVES